MIHTMAQGSEEWKQIRLGKVTASRVIDILPGKSGYKAARKNYMAEKVCEILTGEIAEGFISGPMKWGIETEPYARAAYEAISGNMVTEIGFIDHPSIANFGASPDGLIDSFGPGGLEIKCPNTATHIDTFLHGTIDYKYIIQMQANMMCAGYTWWDFVSYDPRLPDEVSYFCKRIYENADMQATIKKEVSLFLAELGELMQEIGSPKKIER